MKVKKATHKVILSRLYVQENGQSVNFSVDKLADAGSSLKKINEGAKTIDVGEGKQAVQYKDGDIEFTPAEVAILKPLFDEKKEWAAVDAQAVLEIKALFEGK